MTKALLTSISDLLPPGASFNAQFPSFDSVTSQVQLLGDGSSLLTLRDGNSDETHPRFVITEPNTQVAYELTPVPGGFTRFMMLSPLLVDQQTDDSKEPLQRLGWVDHAKKIPDTIVRPLMRDGGSLIGPRPAATFLPHITNADGLIHWEELMAVDAAKESIFELICATYAFEPTVKSKEEFIVTGHDRDGKKYARHHFTLLEANDEFVLQLSTDEGFKRVPILKTIKTKNGRIVITPSFWMHMSEHSKLRHFGEVQTSLAGLPQFVTHEWLRDEIFPIISEDEESDLREPALVFVENADFDHRTYKAALKWLDLATTKNPEDHDSSSHRIHQNLVRVAVRYLKRFPKSKGGVDAIFAKLLDPKTDEDIKYTIANEIRTTDSSLKKRAFEIIATDFQKLGILEQIVLIHIFVGHDFTEEESEILRQAYSAIQTCSDDQYDFIGSFIASVLLPYLITKGELSTHDKAMFTHAFQNILIELEAGSEFFWDIDKLLPNAEERNSFLRNLYKFEKAHRPHNGNPIPPLVIEALARFSPEELKNGLYQTDKEYFEDNPTYYIGFTVWQHGGRLTPGIRKILRNQKVHVRKRLDFLQELQRIGITQDDILYKAFLRYIPIEELNNQGAINQAFEFLKKYYKKNSAITGVRILCDIAKTHQNNPVVLRSVLSKLVEIANIKSKKNLDILLRIANRSASDDMYSPFKAHVVLAWLQLTLKLAREQDPSHQGAVSELTDLGITADAEFRNILWSINLYEFFPTPDVRAEIMQTLAELSDYFDPDEFAELLKKMQKNA